MAQVFPKWTEGQHNKLYTMRCNFTNRFFMLGLLLLCTEVVSVAEAYGNGDRRALNREQTADRRFLNKKFDRAMTLYEKATSDAESAEVQASIHTKAARLAVLSLPALGSEVHPEPGSYSTRLVVECNLPQRNRVGMRVARKNDTLLWKTCCPTC